MLAQWVTVSLVTRFWFGLAAPLRRRRFCCPRVLARVVVFDICPHMLGGWAVDGILQGKSLKLIGVHENNINRWCMSGY